ncbi:ATP-binding protein [Paraburkholderia sp. MPAMCS5]|uniref:ATP-binding protein n=1 Tax=Paraburkholderia sp. MPAMCS5 TaxID=3112563 RepID=UPI002E198AD4|nr:ATP-binding protein [Paraburkholderia sp. MPAMCS5]
MRIPDRQAILLNQQAILARFGEFSLRSDNLDEILTEACRLVAEALQTDMAKVMELHDDRITLLVRAGAGWPPGVGGHATARAERGSSEGYALQTGQPVISRDIATEKRFRYSQFIVDAGVKAMINVVILGAKGRSAYGVLQVDSRTPRDFSETDTAFLRSYANLLAAAVERLRIAAETRKHATSLRESEERYRMLATQIPQLVFTCTSTGERTWSSPQWIDYSGIPEEHSRGFGWLDGIHPDDRQATMAAWNACEPKGEYAIEHRIRRAHDGAYRWFQTRATPVRAEGRVVAWLGTSTDIEEQARVREALQRASEELEKRVSERTAELQHALDTLHGEARERSRAEDRLRHSEKLKAIGQLTGGIAHDFNNMLQAIMSSLSLIRVRMQQGRPADVVALVERAEKGALRAATLTHRLLAFGRQQTLEPRLVSLDAIARDMEDMIRRVVGTGIDVELKLGDGTWLVQCDPNQMESALMNLCVNARDAMPGDGWLTISTNEAVLNEADVTGFEDAQAGRYCCIAVSDTGTGMSPKVMEHAFEPFFTTKPSGQGVGLGLSQIYGFVRQSGGIVQMETTVGKGTTVRLCMPALAHREDVEKSEQDAAKTIVLVEDEQIVREVTAEQLREQGYRVLEADSGAAALRLLQAGARFNLLISDVALPGALNGRQVAETVRQRYPWMPVILVTGYAPGDTLSDMEVIRKPFPPEVLAERVRAKLEQLRTDVE